MFRLILPFFLLTAALYSGCVNSQESSQSKEAIEADRALLELEEEERNEVQRDVSLEVVELDTLVEDSLLQDSIKKIR